MHNSPKLRKFIRHPTDIPIQVTLDWLEDDITLQPYDKLYNVSLGGLSFVSSEAMPEGKTVKVCFPLLDQNRSLTGQVVWNKKLKKGFEVGLQFEDPDELYRLRMIEQICHIEHYRTQIKQQHGRNLSIEEAAAEWIKRYAQEFPCFKENE